MYLPFCLHQNLVLFLFWVSFSLWALKHKKEKEQDSDEDRKANT
jgi:hypothetical protein